MDYELIWQPADEGHLSKTIEYGIAQNKKGETVGQVRVEERGENYYIIIHSDHGFSNKQRICISPRFQGPQEARILADSNLAQLLNAA